MKFSSNIAGSLNADKRQAGGGLQTIMNWHLFFAEGVTKVHQSAAAEPLLDCKSANELANPYTWVDATESVYFLICKYKGIVALASTISESPIGTHKLRLSQPNRRAHSPDHSGPLPSPSPQALAVVQDASVLVSNRPAWCFTWWKYQKLQYPFLSIDKKMGKKLSNQYGKYNERYTTNRN